MVANGMGVAVLSDMVYRPWSLEGRRLEIVSISDAVPSMEVGFAWSNSVEKNVAVDAFREIMQLAIGNDQSYRWALAPVIHGADGSRVTSLFALRL